MEHRGGWNIESCGTLQHTEKKARYARCGIQILWNIEAGRTSRLVEHEGGWNIGVLFSLLFIFVLFLWFACSCVGLLGVVLAVVLCAARCLVLASLCLSLPVSLLQ